MENLDQKTIGNAKSAYFLLFVSIFFLFNKENKYINNSFVKNHTKTAFLIHIGFLLTYIIFITNSLGQNLIIASYSLNNILATSIFILLFLIILYGVYKAHNSEKFEIGDVLGSIKKGSIIDVNGDMKIDERDKLTIILSYIPFIGYIVSGIYFKNKIIRAISKLNLIISLVIILFYIFGNTNIANLFFLFYIIFIVFSSLILITKNELLQINLDIIPSPEEEFHMILCLKKYLQIYFKKEKFVTLKDLFYECRIKSNEKEKILKEELEKKEDLKLPKFLIYIPFINLFYIFFINSRYKFHIINGVSITFLLIILNILGYFNLFYGGISVLFMFPMFYGIGYLQTRLAYKMPFIFCFYELFVGFFKFFNLGTRKLKEKSNEEQSFEGVTKNTGE